MIDSLRFAADEITSSLLASFAIHLVVDVRECLVAIVLLPHVVVQTVVKHGPKFLTSQVRIRIQHLESTIFNIGKTVIICNHYHRFIW